MTPDATEPADASDPEAAPPRDSRGRFTPRADADGEAADAEAVADDRETADAETDADASEAADAETDADDRDAAEADADADDREAADAEADARDAADANADARDAADANADDRDAPDADTAPPPGAPPPDAPAPLPPDALPQAVAAISIGGRLRGYATRLAAADAQPIADAIVDYAARVDGVARGDWPPSASANPSALTPGLVGEAVVPSPFFRWPFVGLLEWIRNALIFMPVLWTWFEFGRASGGYRNYIERLSADAASDSFLVWWLDNDLGRTVIGAVALLLLIVVATAWLGFARDRVERRRAGEASAFAALLAEAEGVGARQRADDPQEAIAAFASVGRDMRDDLRAIGETLTASVRPLADSVGVAQGVMEDMSAAIERQQEQSEAIASSLGRVSDVADRLVAIEASFAEASGAAKQGAEALESIRSSLDPQAGEIARAAAGLDGLATAIGDAAARLGRATEEHGELLAAQAEGAERYREAATTMREVADAVGGVSEVAGRLGALEATFGEMRDAARTNAEALDGVRASLEPQAERYSDAAERIAGMAESIDRAVAQIARATENYGASLRGFAEGAEQLGEAARTMNAVAIRLREDMASP